MFADAYVSVHMRVQVCVRGHVLGVIVCGVIVCLSTGVTVYVSTVFIT